MDNPTKERGNAFFRLLDRYIGIPLVLFLRFFKRLGNKKKRSEVPRSISLIKLGAIGDSILTMPFIRELKEADTDVRITVICGKNNRSVYRTFLDAGYLDQIIFVEFTRLIRDWPYLFRKVKEIRSLNCDVCIDFDSWFRISALISSLVKADYKMGFQKEGQHKHYLFDEVQEHKDDCHEFENYRRLVATFTGTVRQFPDYPVAEEDSLFFDEFVSARHIQKYIVLHPWASGYKSTLKELDTNSLVYVGNKLASEGYAIILTGGKGDTEKSASLSALISGSISIAGKTSLNETAIFLKNAQCVVTVNTGILHLAAAMDSSIVSVNGPTSIERWGPLSEKSINITSDLLCSPCLDLGFEYKCHEQGVPEGHCMKKINLDKVVEATLEMTQRSKIEKSLQS